LFEIKTHFDEMGMREDEQLSQSRHQREGVESWDASAHVHTTALPVKESLSSDND
jgi:hypothetical protein